MPKDKAPTPSSPPRRSILPALLAILVVIGVVYLSIRGVGLLLLHQSKQKLAAGDAAGAVSTADTAMSLLPGNVDAMVQLAVSESRNHNHAAAYTAYKFAHQSKPDDRDIFLSMCREGLFEQELVQQSKALTDYVNANPGDGTAMLLLGETFERMPSAPDTIKQSMDWIMKAEQALPGDPEVEAVVGSKFLSSNHPSDALNYFNTKKTKKPNNQLLLRGALTCYDQLGDRADAAKVAAQIDEAKPVDVDLPPLLPRAPTPAVSTDPVPGRFVDVARQAGIDYDFRMVVAKPQNILQTIGTGCAFLDYNNDGNLDILIVGDMTKLYQGDGHGHFTDVTHATGVDKVHGYFMGCAVGDIDNDGFDDIVLTGFNAFALLRNAGGKSFEDVTPSSGIKVNGWTSGAAFGDVDGDGKLDLFVGRYVDMPLNNVPYCIQDKLVSSCGPKAFAPQFGSLYHNDGGHFADVTKQWGVDKLAAKNLGAAFADFDGSGRQSLYVANDTQPANLFVNNGHAFQDVAKTAGTAVKENGDPFSGMGVDWGDYDNDGRLDLMAMSYQGEEKRILHNEGSRFFSQQFTPLGFQAGCYMLVSFGSKWFDYDNDGWLDFVAANGHVDDSAQNRIKDTTFLQPTNLYHNEHGKHFTNAFAALQGDLRRPIEGRGLAVGDYENNGKMGVLIIDSNGRPELIENQTPSTGHWLDLALVGTKSNRDGYGAIITVTAGGQTQVRLCHADGSYFSSSDKRVHVGLGTSTTADKVDIRWPSGHVDTLTNVHADKVMTITEGKS